MVVVVVVVVVPFAWDVGGNFADAALGGGGNFFADVDECWWGWSHNLNLQPSNAYGGVRYTHSRVPYQRVAKCGGCSLSLFNHSFLVCVGGWAH